jgi:hypothetical protein
MSNEGPEFYGFIFDILHSELSIRGIPRERVVFISQNRWIGRAYDRYYARGMRFWSCDYFPKAVAVWMQQGGEGETDFPVSGYTPLSGEGEPRFLSLNAAARWHRLLLYRWLQMEGLLGEGLVSFHGVNPENPKSNEIDIAAPPIEIAETFPELLQRIEAWMPAAPQTLNRAPASGNHLIMTIDREAYAGSLLSIVTESDFFAAGVERLTEKSIKAAGMGHPFIIVGPPRTVSKLAELGFCTFSGLIDHTYDLIDDADLRMMAVFATIRETWRRVRADPASWRRLAGAEAEYNYRHARNGLVQRMDQLMTMPLVQRMLTFVDTGQA